MRASGREKGEGNFGCLVGLILLAIAVYVAWKVIPVKVKAAEVRETVIDEAKSAGSHNDGLIREAILAKGREDSLPIKEEDISITRAASRIVVDVNYVVPIEFPGYTYQWHINHHAENPIF